MPEAPLPRLSPNHAEMLVLSVLAEGPSYGYAITKAIDLGSEGSFAMGAAKLYPLLARLDKQGLVTTTWEEVKARDSDDETNGRRRKWYTLSPKGERRLEQHVQAHRRFTALIDAFLPPLEARPA
ncbi:MAG: helix-turn-helix transcriptional regulator [Phycisphaeraceae bacterium]|nr:MAG: helix-turn-helix transcriptional regulator [Phycisphaeraceae bacterium]